MAAMVMLGKKGEKERCEKEKGKREERKRGDWELNGDGCHGVGEESRRGKIEKEKKGGERKRGERDLNGAPMAVTVLGRQVEVEIKKIKKRKRKRKGLKWKLAIRGKIKRDKKKKRIFLKKNRREKG